MDISIVIDIFTLDILGIATVKTPLLSAGTIVGTVFGIADIVVKEKSKIF
jgi:hypothetical protein